MNIPQSSSSNTKIIIVGSASIGKSTFIQYYVNGKYLINPQSTVSLYINQNNIKVCDFFVKTVKHKSETIRLEIWDTAGQQKYQNLINQFYRNTSAAILAFDINNRESLQNLDFWYNDLNNQLDQDVIKVIIATRCDLKGKKFDDLHNPIQAIDDKEIEKYIQEKGLKYFETSSKANQNVKETFDYIIDEIIKNQSFNGDLDNGNNNNISLYDPTPNKKEDRKNCC